MYGLAVGTDVSGLRGRAVEQIALGQYQAQVRLSGGAGVYVEGDFSVTDADGRRRDFTDVPDAAAALAGLLGCDVDEAEVASPGVLTLVFSNGARMDVHDSNDRYESYQIAIGDQLIVV